MKTMKHIIAAIAVMLTAVAAAAEDYVIMWDVFDPKLPTGESVYFDYATIQVNYNDNTFANLYDLSQTEATIYTLWNEFDSEYAYTEDATYGMIDSSKAESFFVQLYEAGDGYPDPSTDKVVAWSTFSASDLGEHTFGPLNAVFIGYSVSQVIPEPTSGLLLLFGVAGLALKRRRQAV